MFYAINIYNTVRNEGTMAIVTTEVLFYDFLKPQFVFFLPAAKRAGHTVERKGLFFSLLLPAAKPTGHVMERVVLLVGLVGVTTFLP